jgi:uncharacterized protein YbbK (DUF523 family)
MRKNRQRKIRIAISACLMGERVRYDGGHKRNDILLDTLGDRFELLPVCPESGCGLPTPREPIRLEGEPQNPRLMTIHTGCDHTRRMRSYCRKMVSVLEEKNVCGFILKSSSPSCGLRGIKVFREGKVVRKGMGIFSEAVANHFPQMPLIEETTLKKPKKTDDFIENVLAYQSNKVGG